MSSSLKHGAGATPVASSSNASTRPGNGTYKCRATQLQPAWNRLVSGEPVALDIEFQTFKPSGEDKYQHRVGRVAIVNSVGETVLDVYAAYRKEEGTAKRMPPARFGVDKRDLLYSNGAVPAHTVERWVKQIIKGRTVILHGGKHDKTAFPIEGDIYTSSIVVDTQVLFSYVQPSHGTPGLATTAEEILGEVIQLTGHSPVEDAVTAMKLYKHGHKFDRDAALAQQIVDKATSSRSNHAGKKRRQDRAARDNDSSATTSPEILDQKVAALNILDEDEFPSLAAAKQKR